MMTIVSGLLAGLLGLAPLATSAWAHAALERTDARPDTPDRGGMGRSDIPAAGQDPRTTKATPGMRMVQAAPSPAQAATVKAGDLAIEVPWLRATPNGAKVAGGYVRITNTGTQADTLKAASVPFAEKADIHSMSMEGGVMRMASVPGGLAIRPDETVELKPGGYHLMFEGLTAALKAGDTVSGTLTFERAGTVPVTFSVAPIGALGPGMQHHH